jgi:hypothetical protein
MNLSSIVKKRKFKGDHVAEEADSVAGLRSEVDREDCAAVVLESRGKSPSLKH